jgi:L-fuconate dehydratase
LPSRRQAGLAAGRRHVGEEIADIVDYRYLTDVLTRDEAVAILKRAETGKAERIATLEAEGYACYTTSAGWLRL